MTITPSTSRRRNRDLGARAGGPATVIDAPDTAQPEPPPPVAPLPVAPPPVAFPLAAPQLAGAGPEPGSTDAQSPEAVIAHGHRWLRFPAALEARFQADCLEPRRRLLLLCMAIGTVAICLGSVSLPQLVPDAAELAMVYLWWILGTAVAAQLVLWRMPPAWWRPWQGEAVTSLPVLSVNVAVILDCMASQADTMFTHSAALVSTLMFSCIAARLRFYWSLGCAVVSFAAYVGFVRGTTPQQELIVAATAGLMALSYVFALLANYAFEHAERRNWLLEQAEARQRTALDENSRQLRRLTAEDALTGLPNRRGFDTALEAAWRDAAAAHQPLALLMVDVDHFKRYNDHYGHPAGDACLVKVAAALAEVAAAFGGLPGRLGGEEFGLLLPGATAERAVAAGEALCGAVRAAGIEHVCSLTGRVTVSVGAACAWPGEGEPATAALAEAADRALYAAKTSGRDRVCEAPSGWSQAEGASQPAQPAPAQPPLHQPQAGPDPESESELVQTLAGGFRRLRFPAAMEADWRRHDAAWRRKHIAQMAVVGLLIYMIYTWANRAMFSDVAPQVLRWQMQLTAAMLVLTAVAYYMPMGVRWREGVFSFGNACVGVSTAWFLSQSQQLTALAFSVCLVLIPMFSGVAARQPFRFTCVPAVLTCVAAAVLMRPDDAQQALVATDSITMIATNTLFTLMLSYAIEHGARKRWLLASIHALQRRELERTAEALRALSLQDALTGIANRRQFEADLQRLWQDALRDGRAMALLIIDVDFFKRFNDGYGHLEGDRCLQQVAQAIARTALQHKALASRLGGEEFGVLMPAVPASRPQAVQQLGEALCAAVRELGIEHAHTEVAGQRCVTVSVGGATLAAVPDANPRLLLSRADDALYQAKHAGRNGVQLARDAGPQATAAGPKPAQPAEPAEAGALGRTCTTTASTTG